MDGNAILKATEALDAVVGVLTSYKAKLVAAGFDNAVAEQMCVALNAGLLSQMLTAAAARVTPRSRR